MKKNYWNFLKKKNRKLDLKPTRKPAIHPRASGPRACATGPHAPACVTPRRFAWGAAGVTRVTPSRPVTYYKFYVVRPKLAQIYFVPEYFLIILAIQKIVQEQKNFVSEKK